jgi:hypothetical protein
LLSASTLPAAFSTLANTARAEVKSTSDERSAFLKILGIQFSLRSSQMQRDSPGERIRKDFPQTVGRVGDLRRLPRKQTFCAPRIRPPLGWHDGAGDLRPRQIHRPLSIIDYFSIRSTSRADPSLRSAISMRLGEDGAH